MAGYIPGDTRSRSSQIIPRKPGARLPLRAHITLRLAVYDPTEQIGFYALQFLVQESKMSGLLVYLNDRFCLSPCRRSGATSLSTIKR
jgi:hypothetical protein